MPTCCRRHTKILFKSDKLLDMGNVQIFHQCNSWRYVREPRLVQNKRYLSHSLSQLSRRQIDDIFLIFQENRIWNLKFCILDKIKKNISKCRLLKILPKVLSVYPAYPKIWLGLRINAVWSMPSRFTLRKHAYSNIQLISPPKTENFEIKNTVIFHISAQNIDCWYSLEPPRRGGSNEYPQSMSLSRYKKNNVYPC